MFVLLGANHHSAPVSLRERLAFSGEELRGAVERLQQIEGIGESMVLSTCNRVELLCRTEDTAAGLRALRGFLVEERRVTEEELDRFGYHFTDADAVDHMIRVAAGLDSMVLGEPQILGQVKQAFAVAREAGSVGPILDRLFRRTLATAKRIRTETGISRHAVSVASTAAQLARKIFGNLDGRSVLLLGAGKMGALVATHLTAAGVEEITVASRTYNHACAFAREHGARACRWEEGLQRLRSVDIVVSGTAAVDQVLTKEIVQEAMRKRRSEPLFLIDIAVPRDIDPQANRIDNVYVYDIDDLQGVVDTGLDERRRSSREAEGMVREEVDRFQRWLGTLEVKPVIVSLREALHGVGASEFVRFRRRLGDLNRDQEEEVANLVRSIVQKILHRPIRHLKGAAEEGGATDVTDQYRRIFGIRTEENGTVADEDDRAEEGEE